MVSDTLTIAAGIVVVGGIFYWIFKNYKSNNAIPYNSGTMSIPVPSMSDWGTSPKDKMIQELKGDNYDDMFRNSNSVTSCNKRTDGCATFKSRVETGDDYAAFGCNTMIGDFKPTPRKEPSGSLDPDIYDSNQFLPQEKNNNWFTALGDEPIALKNNHLIDLQQRNGINTVLSSLRNATHDLRGAPPNPKIAVSPWNQSTIDPDYNIRPWGCA